MTNLLMVEDDSGIVKVVTAMLSRQGYTVLWAPNVERAKDILTSRGVQVILSDYHLPDGTAIDVLNARNELGKAHSVPFVIMSAMPETETIKLIAQNGIKHFICKPVTRNTLVKTLAKALATHSLQ